MTVVAIPWGILTFRSSRKTAVAKAKDGSSLLHSIPTLWALAAIGVALIAGAIGAYQFVLRDVPDIKQGIQAIQKDLKDAEQRQRTDLSAHTEQEQNARGRLDSQMKVMQSNMIAVRQIVERRKLKPAEIKELLTNVRDVSTSEATQLNSHTTISGPPLPQMPTAIAAAVSSDEIPKDVAEIFIATGKGYEKFPVGKHVARVLMLKNNKWEATKGGIKVTYEGGAAMFEAKSNVQFVDLQKQADLLNSLSQAVGMSGWPTVEMTGSQIPRDQPEAPPIR